MKYFLFSGGADPEIRQVTDEDYYSITPEQRRRFCEVLGCREIDQQTYRQLTGNKKTLVNF